MTSFSLAELDRSLLMSRMTAYRRKEVVVKLFEPVRDQTNNVASFLVGFVGCLVAVVGGVGLLLLIR